MYSMYIPLGCLVYIICPCPGSWLAKYESIQLICLRDTGQPRNVKLAYLKYTAYVEVIIHSRAFPLYCSVFQTCLCPTWLSQILGYIEVVFHSQKLVFGLVTTTYVEANFVLVKKLNHMNVTQSN